MSASGRVTASCAKDLLLRIDAIYGRLVNLRHYRVLPTYFNTAGKRITATTKVLHHPGYRQTTVTSWQNVKN